MSAGELRIVAAPADDTAEEATGDVPEATER